MRIQDSGAESPGAGLGGGERGFQGFKFTHYHLSRTAEIRPKRTPFGTQEGRFIGNKTLDEANEREERSAQVLLWMLQSPCLEIIEGRIQEGGENTI
jgi:hypothetical protein